MNYLDIGSRIQIEELILEYQPTMIFAEHDDTFREKIATKTIEIQAKERVLQEYLKESQGNLFEDPL